MPRFALLVIAVIFPLEVLGAQDCGGVKEQIRFMRDADQSIRYLLYQAEGKEKVGAMMEVVDRTNTAQMKRIVADCGWPTISAIGPGAADAAWLIAQHADRDSAFQRRVVELMTPLVARGEADPINLAYLTDRTELAANRQQLYGTQFTVELDGTLKPRPCDDLARVAQRRAAIGLPTLETYLAESRALMDRWAHPKQTSADDAKREINP